MGQKYHPHKYYQIDRKMWKCALTCGWGFIWKGLEHTLIGKPAVCWNCDQVFSMDMGNLLQDKPTCYGCSPVSKIEETNPLTGTVKLNTPTYDIVEPVRTLEEIMEQYEVLKVKITPSVAEMWKESELKRLEEFKRAQARHTKQSSPVDSTNTDQIEDEYIPPNYEEE